MIIFVHGNVWSGSSTGMEFIDDFWETDRFKNWNVGTLKWWTCNNPDAAYLVVGKFLIERLKQIILHGCRTIEDTTIVPFTGKEIRLVAFSWGVHVVNLVARDLLDFIKSNNLKIAVTVDLIDPTLLAGYPKPIVDYHGKSATARDHIRNNLEFVANKNNQVIGINQPNTKLFTILIAGSYIQWSHHQDFLKYVVNPINEHVALGVKGDEWQSHESVVGVYKDCELASWINFDDPKVIPGTTGASEYQPGETWLEKCWVHSSDYNYIDHAPIYGEKWEGCHLYYKIFDYTRV